MAVMMPREKWTDQRLDDLNQKVDDGFTRVDARFDRVEDRLEKLDDRFGSLNRTLIGTGGAIVAALLGIIATQL